MNLIVSENQAMNRLFWNRPHPFIFNSTSFAVPGMLTFIVIFILAPFHFSELAFANRFTQALLSTTIVCISILIVVFGIKIIFPFWSKEESWNIGKEFMLFSLIVVFIAIAHFELLSFQSEKGGSLALFQQVVLRTLAISFFPILGLVLFEQHNHRTQQLKKALYLNRKIRAYQQETLNAINNSQFDQEMLWFLGENGKPVCQLNPRNIQFVKSEGNYYELYYLNEHLKFKKQLVRNKLSEVERILPHSFFKRTHRSFIVNLEHVENVNGNARELTLVMKLTNKTIPVSRSKASTILSELSDLSYSSHISPSNTK